MLGLLTTIPSLLAGPYGFLIRIGIMALVAGGIFLTGWLKGNAHGTQKLYDYQAAEAKEAVRIAKDREVVTTKVVTKYLKIAGETQVVTKTIEKEVAGYANPTFTLDLAWRRLHDASALNRLPDPAPGTDAAPRAAEALATVTANYGTCHADQDRLEALQAWVRAQAGVK